MVESTADDTVQCLTTKEIKALARPEFQADPDKFYPTELFKKLGFSRAQCGICQNFYWRHSEKRVTCGDSNCDGKYSFIGDGLGKGEKITFADAWKGFEESMTTARIPCNSIKRYPVVARWRNDVDYVAAGIFCFQPYCVTGELDPPANPLICPQFCLRFNDLDNIGLTGRHYSGFIMLGIQVFNYPDKYHFFKDECVEFNYRWLTETLKIDPDEITFIEDVWAGGGNLGPSIEYFVRGLEVGNMVFMQYKTFHDGSREELDVKVIDVGIGLERIAWLMNGSYTSYTDTFAKALAYMQPLVEVDIDKDIWNKFGPYSCTLNIDETDDIEKTWQELADKIKEPVEKVKQNIQIVKEMFIILDHTRSILIAISDGSLPSNVGGGGNIRNILRRCFSVCKKNGWWEKLGGMDGFLGIFESHKKDLEGIFGPFPEYKSFDQIIKVEYERWCTTDGAHSEQLKKLLKKKKNVLSIDDWITAMQAWGIPADKIAELSNSAIPGNLYYEIATRQERVGKAAEKILYNTIHLPETENLYYADSHLFDFDSKVVTVYANVLEQNKKNLVILDKSAFYPTSGGQIHDTGVLAIEGIERQFKVIDVIKVGKVVLHQVDSEIEEDIVGKVVKGTVDKDRRSQLQAHHTGTHIVFASCRKVLGPHIWQAGAKKTTEQAHLDITHYRSLTREEEKAIENHANRLINDCHNITKGFMDKAEAEREYGFSLYQGGIVPGNSLRVVNIEGVDTEACCGTHADNTAEVGWIKLIKSQRISDGIVRLYYVAQERAIDVMNKETGILDHLCEAWSVDKTQLTNTGDHFFAEKKRLSALTQKQNNQILDLQIKYFLVSPNKLFFVRSLLDNGVTYVSTLPAYAEQIKENGKGIIFMGNSFICGLLGSKDLLNMEEFEQIAGSVSAKPIKVSKKESVSYKFKEKGKKPINVKEVLQFQMFGHDFNVDKLAEFLQTQGVSELE